MRKYILLFLLLLVLVPRLYSHWRSVVEDKVYYMTNSVVTTGDAAQVIKVHLFQALDSFVYIDSIYPARAFGTDSIAQWTSPNQSMSLTVEGTDVDTTQTLNCSIVFSAQTLGFDLVIEDDERDTGVAILVDTLVYLFNNTTNLKDSILAEDSVSYVKIVSRFGEQVIGTWSAKFVPAAGDTLDTASIAPTTIKMVCDSMAAAVNGEDSIGVYVTAANSGDTVYTLTADDPGYAFSLGFGDTAQDSSLTTANGTSWSRSVDTTYIFSMTAPDKYKTLYGRVIIEPSTVTLQGYGLSDSSIIRLYAEGINGYSQIAVDSNISVPCTLFVNFPGAAATVLSDTIFKERLYLVTEIADSASDSTFSPTHRVIFHMVKQQ